MVVFEVRDVTTPDGDASTWFEDSNQTSGALFSSLDRAKAHILSCVRRYLNDETIDQISFRKQAWSDGSIGSWWTKGLDHGIAYVIWTTETDADDAPAAQVETAIGALIDRLTELTIYEAATYGDGDARKRIEWLIASLELFTL